MKFTIEITNRKLVSIRDRIILWIIGYAKDERIIMYDPDLVRLQETKERKIRRFNRPARILRCKALYEEIILEQETNEFKTYQLGKKSIVSNLVEKKKVQSK